VFTKNIYWFYPRAISPHICDQIIKLGNWYKEDLAVTSAQIDKDLSKEEEIKELNKVRNSRIAWIPHMYWFDIWFNKYLEDANKSAGWNFKINSGEQYQFTKYKEGHFYGWHQDSGPDTLEDGFQRKLSLVCSLTDPSEYEGGDLEIFSPNQSPAVPNEKKIFTEPEWKAQGTVIVFPSHLWHQVKKVTKGTRYSLVTWYRGKDFE
jgi:PKHD-type hydroxylase